MPVLPQKTTHGKAGRTKKHGQFEERYGKSFSAAVAELTPIPDEEIIATRDLLAYVVVLYGFEKAFRVSGRGVGIAIESDGRIARFIPEPINEGLIFYDRRVQSQSESGQVFVSAGFPGCAMIENSSPDQLFVMTRLRPEQYSEFMTRLRQQDQTEFNAMNFCPAFLDVSKALDFLRQMPEGTALKTGGLSPGEIIVCLHAVSRIGVVAFNDRTTRFWIGCYGLLPIAPAEFVKRFNFHVKEQLPSYPGGKIDELRDKFVKSFSLPNRQGHTEFDRSNVHRYMTASGAFFIFDEEKSVMIDYLGLPNDLNSWLASLRLDGRGKEPKRGILFEKWLRSELESCVRARSLETAAMPEQGLIVKIEPQHPHTDIDVVLPIPPWLIVISCKNYEMKDGEFRGVARDVRNRWDKLHDDLTTWDEKMRHLFHNEGRDWRILNPKLAELAIGCSQVLPILVTPRVEWIPVLKPELILHPGRANGEGITSFPVPRIGTLDDLKRMFLMGGPKPVQPDWVISI